MRLSFVGHTIASVLFVSTVAISSTLRAIELALEKSERVMIERDQTRQLDFRGGGAKNPDRDHRRLSFGKTKRTGRDRWESQRLRPQLVGHLQDAPITRCKRLLLPSRPAEPDRSHGVDDPSSLQIKARSGFRVAGLAATEHTAGGQQPGTGRTMYRTVDSPAA